MERISSYHNGYFDGLIAYHTERKEPPKDFGVSYALRAYYRTNEMELAAYTVEEMPFEQDIPVFLATLDKAGITEFNLCECSTALMVTLHCLIEAGWQIGEPVKQNVDCFTTLYGLHMKKANQDTGRVCRRCGEAVTKLDDPEYSYYCAFCDTGLFPSETKKSPKAQ